MRFIPKAWVTEAKALGPVPDPDVATPLNGDAFTDLETRLASHAETELDEKTLVSLADVDATSPANGEILEYQGGLFIPSLAPASSLAASTLKARQLDTNGTAKLLTTGAVVRARYEAATDHLEDWADLTEVTSQNVKVEGNKLLYTTGSKAQGAKIPITVGADGLLFTARIYMGEPNVFVGCGFAGSSNEMKESSTDAFIVGCRSTGSLGYLVGTEIGGTGQASFGGAGSEAIEIGEELLVTGAVTGGQVSLAITRLKNGQTFKRNSGSLATSVFEPVGGVKHIILYTGTKSKIGPVTIAGALTQPHAKTNAIENVAAERKHVMVNLEEDRRQLILAPGNNPLVPAPLVVYLHNAGGSEMNSVQDVRIVPFVNALSAAGYNIVMANAGGSTWGNDACRAAYIAAYKWARGLVATSSVILSGQSMGGQVAFNLLPRFEIPNVVATLLVAPVTSLDDLWEENKGGYSEVIRESFGIEAEGGDYEAKTAGYRPEDRQGWEFRGVPTMIIASPEDHTCHIVHAEELLAKMLPYTPAATLIKSTGAHMEAPQFEAAVTYGIPFLATYA